MQSMQLSEAQPGPFRVLAILATDALPRKLSDMGLHVGDKIDVLGNQGASGVVVGCSDARLALDRTTAEKVRVVSFAGGDMIGIGDLRPGDKARVAGLKKGDRDYRQRLMAMGLTPGIEFTLTRFAPLGDPIEIRVRNSALSLRKGEAELLMLERV